VRNIGALEDDRFRSQLREVRCVDFCISNRVGPLLVGQEKDQIRFSRHTGSTTDRSIIRSQNQVEANLLVPSDFRFGSDAGGFAHEIRISNYAGGLLL